MRLTVDLKRMRYLINRLPMARFRMEQATARATRCTAGWGGVPGGGFGGSQVERGAELRDAALTAYTEIRQELDGLRQELRPMLEELDRPLERIVMEMRYLDGYSVREIAYRLSYCEQWIFRTLTQAEGKISKRGELGES